MFLTVIVVTNDRANALTADLRDLLALTHEEGGEDGSDRATAASSKRDSTGRKRPQVLYDAHLPLSEIMAGIRAGATARVPVYPFEGKSISPSRSCCSLLNV